VGAIVRQQSARVVQRAWRAAAATRDAARAFVQLGLSDSMTTATTFSSFSSLLVSKTAREVTREWLVRVEEMTREAPLDVTTLACLQALSPRACASGACEKFPVRLMLSAYMVVRYPDVVLGGAAPNVESAPEEEVELMRSAESFTSCMTSVATRCAETARLHCTETTALAQSWSHFVEKFTRWKVLDACALENELVRIGVAMTASMIRVCGCNAANDDLDVERRAIREAQARDVELLRSKIATLTGDVGVMKFDEMITAVQERAEEAEAFARAADVNRVVGEYASHEPASAVETLENRRRAREETSAEMREAIQRDKCLAAKQYEQDCVVDIQCDKMFHELLIDPSWTPGAELEVGADEDDGGAYQSVKKAVHDAFWDSLYQSLVQTPVDLDLLNAQVYEFRVRVLDAAVNVGVDEHTLANIRQHVLAMDAIVLNDVIATMREEPEKAIAALRAMLLAGYSALQCLVEDDQDASASIAERYDALKKHLDETTKLDGDDLHDVGTSIAHAVVSALSFLLPVCEEICVKSVCDMLDVIRPSARSEHGPLFAREKFMRRHGLESEHLTCAELSVALPSTRTWIANVSSQRVNHMDAELTPILSALANSVKLRSGFEHTSSTASTTTKVIPTRVCSMDGVVRLAFVATITARGMNSWPETLLFDQQRLFELQNDFQLLHVLAACAVLCKQLDPGVKDIETLITRCSAHLRHEQGRLSDVAKEIKLISPSTIVDTEDTIVSMLRRLTECGDADDRTASASELSSVNSMSTIIFDSLRAALSIRLLLGFDDDKVTRLVHTKLAKIGSIALKTRVDELARKLWHVCSVSMKIHAPFYHTFAHELILRDEDEI